MNTPITEEKIKEEEKIAENDQILTEEEKEEEILEEEEIEGDETEEEEKTNLGRPKGAKNRKTILRERREQRKLEERAKPTFLEIVTSSGRRADRLNIYGENPAYSYRWCAKNSMANGVKDIWHTVPKGHPDFIGLRVEVDHTPEQSYFTCGDLVLCCARKETVEARRKANQEKMKRREALMDAQTKEVLSRVSREGVASLSKRTLEMFD